MIINREVEDNKPIQYTRKYSIYLQIQDQESPQLIVELPNQFTVEDCIKYCLDQFNKDSQPTQQLKWSPKQYQLRCAKKNGKAKEDLPCLDMEQVLIDIGAIVFVIIVLPEERNSIVQARTSYTNGLAGKQKPPIKGKENGDKEKLCTFNCI